MPDTSPSKSFLSRFLGIKEEAKDIELPTQRKKDKRLKSKYDTAKEGYGIFKNLGKSQD